MNYNTLFMILASGEHSLALFPFFIPIILTLLGLGGAAMLVAAVSADHPETKGKSFALIGAPAAGKTTFARFLQKGTIEPTVSTSEVNKLKLDPPIRVYAEVDVEKIIDTPSHRENSAYDEEVKQFREAKYIFVIFNAKNISGGIGGDETSMRRLTGILGKEEFRDKNKIIVAIGTHTDEINGWGISKETELRQKNIIRGVIVPNLENAGKFGGVFFGSLNNVENAKGLTYSIFSELARRGI